jgi:4,5-dihydroxyphthalate decarboxylase
MLPWGVAEAERTIALLGKDFWPYGVDANRATLAAFLRYSYEQGLAAKLWRPADLFVPETLESALV